MPGLRHKFHNMIVLLASTIIFNEDEYIHGYSVVSCSCWVGTYLRAGDVYSNRHYFVAQNYGKNLVVINLSLFFLSVPQVQGGSNMTGTDLCVNKPQCAAAVRP